MISEEFGMKPNYLSKLFKKEKNIGILNFINKHRISESKKLLKTATLTISQISEKVGFDSSNSFIRVFKQYEGVTPGNFMKNARG